MKLHERGGPRRRVKVGEVLEHTVPAGTVFDIRREVSDQDWQQISQEVNERVAMQWASSQEIIVEQLVVLGSENRTTVDLDTVCAKGLAEAKRQFQRKLDIVAGK
ncbi:MAG: hypothetical protein AAB558_00885 [Patescibacteria group bacterium]